jgi:methionine salvage enolase-phosphatase E1
MKGNKALRVSRIVVGLQILFVASFAVTSLFYSSFFNDSEHYDLVINNGRVIDPETHLDAVRHIGIRDGTIVAISDQPLNSEINIDATDLVVAPGFIDVHSHSPTVLGQHFNVLDGVTTQLDLEAGSFPVSFYGEHLRAGAAINYGSSVVIMRCVSKS